MSNGDSKMRSSKLEEEEFPSKERKQLNILGTSKKK